MSRRAKIVCTLGPASSSPERLAALVAAGLDVARLNMSHGTRTATSGPTRRSGPPQTPPSGHSVGVLVDLQGPKIRLGIFPAAPVRLSAGQEFTITAEDVPGDSSQASTTYTGLADDVRPGDRVLVDDGRIVLEVLAVRGTAVRTRVVVGGMVSDHKGINLPGVKVSVPALTAKDEADLRWALRLRADMIALSFVQGPEDAVPARRLARYRSPIPLLAFTPVPSARSQLALTWGVETFIVPPVTHTDDMVHQVDNALFGIGRCDKGDLVVIVAGTPPGSPGTTNALRVHRIGDTVGSDAGLRG
jgi:pyruvate kinase